MAQKAHLITGGFPLGSNAGHDMDYVRIQLLQVLYAAGFQTTLASSFEKLGEQLADSKLLVTYVAGPFPNDDQCQELEAWLEGGGRWLALHGTSGGKAARVADGGGRRQMVRLAHHDLLGAFFLNHPPIRKFTVRVEASGHPIFKGLPEEFEVMDELYLIEPMDDSTPLLTTKLPQDPSPEGFGFVYDKDTSLLEDGKTRVLGTERCVGNGAVVYVALGHTHAPANNSQPFVDSSVTANGETPLTFRGVWEDSNFKQLLENGAAWGAAA